MAVAHTEEGQAATPRQAAGRAKTRKVTVTIPADTLEAAASKVREGFAASLSAYVSKALARQVALDGERDSYLAFLDRLDEELGPPSPEAYAWAREVLGLSPSTPEPSSLSNEGTRGFAPS